MNQSLLFKSLSLTGIVFLLLIALAFIGGTIGNRADYREQALYSVGKSWTHQQTLTLPFLTVPYTTIATEKYWDKEQQIYHEQIKKSARQLFIPLETLALQSELTTEVLHRGIFEIPVYQSTLRLNGFLLIDELKALRQRTDVVMDQSPYLAIAVSDQRGLIGVPTFESDSLKGNVQPGSGLSEQAQGFKIELPELNTNGQFEIEFKLKGMSSLFFIPSAKDTSVSIRSDWNHPKFDGAFLPIERSITSQGYTAHWQTSYFASSVNQALSECSKDSCDALRHLAFGVNHIEPVDHYLKSERSVKYGILIILLTFVCFILFELLQASRLHAVHYLLVGLALALFYLLLIAFSEHIGFGWSYLVSSLVSILLIGFYMSYQMSRAISVGLVGGLGVLFGVIYLIILSEDYALVSGAVLCFTSLGLIMLVTRRINWLQNPYGSAKNSNQNEEIQDRC